MAARKNYLRHGIALRRTIGGYAATIGGGCFTFRRKEDGTWKPNGHHHKAQPISSLTTLGDAVLWAKGHIRYCQGGCTAESGPFDNVKVEPRKPTDPASDDCHTY
jgi:hypothetical protein